VHGVGLEDLAPDAAVPHVMLPLPARGCGCAGEASRAAAAFGAWRRRAAAGETGGRRLAQQQHRRICDTPQHLGGLPGAQLQGHVTLGAPKSANA